VVGARFELVVEVAVLEAPVRPAAGEAMEHLAGVVLAAERRVGRRLGAPQPLGDALFGDADRRGRDAGLPKILLSEDVGRDLGPAARDLAVLGLEDDLAVGIDDPRRAGLERESGVRVAGLRVGPGELHAGLRPLARRSFRRREAYGSSNKRSTPSSPLARAQRGRTP